MRIKAVREIVAEEILKQWTLKPSPKPYKPANNIDSPVRFRESSCNRKLSPQKLLKFGTKFRQIPQPPFVSSTYVSIEATCPKTCPFKSNGCYVDAGFTRFSSRQMNESAAGWEPLAVIREEVLAIAKAFKGGPIPQDGARGGRDLRLHIGGDAGTRGGAKLLAEAARRWRYERGGGSVWSYTHMWKTIPREAWGEAIAVLASVETPAQIEEARARGYASAIVVSRFPNGDKAFKVEGSTAEVIPCPAETRDVTCSSCRLCLDRDLLAMDKAIGFSVHGSHAGKVHRSLKVLNNEQMELLR